MIDDRPKKRDLNSIRALPKHSRPMRWNGLSASTQRGDYTNHRFTNLVVTALCRRPRRDTESTPRQSEAATAREAAITKSDARAIAMPVQIDSPTARQCGEAGWLRWRYKISTADAIIATQAITNDAELVTKTLSSKQ